MYPKSKGFTLIEILLALFIFTLIALMLNKGLQFIITSQSTTEQAARTLSQIQTAHLVFSHDVGTILVKPLAKNLSENVVGTASECRFAHFYLPFSPTDNASAPRQYSRYRFTQGQWLRETWFEQDGKRFGWQRKILIKDLQQLRIRYLDHDHHFHLAWPPADNTSSFPAAIEVNFLFAQGALQQLYPLPQQIFAAPTATIQGESS